MKTMNINQALSIVQKRVAERSPRNNPEMRVINEALKCFGFTWVNEFEIRDIVFDEDGNATIFTEYDDQYQIPREVLASDDLKKAAKIHSLKEKIEHAKIHAQRAKDVWDNNIKKLEEELNDIV